MLPGLSQSSQKGYIAAVVIVFMLLISAFIFPWKFPLLEKKSADTPDKYCRDLVNDPNAPTIETVSYDASGIQLGTARKYVLLKQKVAMNRSLLELTEDEHFYTDFKEPYTDPKTQKKYVIRIPKGKQGQSYKLPSEVGTEDYLQFSDYGLIYLFYADDKFEPIITDEFQINSGGDTMKVIMADIYKAVDTPELPEWVLKCYDAGTGGVTEGIFFDRTGVVVPKQSVSPDKDELQLEWFLFVNYKLLLQAWWTPHCKPAVYLYPETKQLVNVRVLPKGELGLTDPPYDSASGWTVQAFPNGELFDSYNSSQITQGYLYYESRLEDRYIKKPDKGWVVKFDELENLYNKVLPKLGLNKKEAEDFKEYWLKTLPKSPYYFVGLIEKDQRDYLETLEVTPNPDTSIRFSLYFEPLDQPRTVVEPDIKAPERKGFTLVDWGGMIKLKPGTPFTCSQ